jgi:hypothetical protein
VAEKPGQDQPLVDKNGLTNPIWYEWLTKDKTSTLPVITPEQFGAAVGGTDCTAAFVSLANYINTAGGGFIVNFSKGDYHIWPAGSAPSPSKIFQLTSVTGLTFNFNGARIFTDNGFGWGVAPYIFYMDHVSNIIFNDPVYYAPSAPVPPSPVDGGGFITIFDTTHGWSENVHVFNAIQNGGQAFFQIGFPPESEGGYAKNFSVINADLYAVFYGLNFQGSGDNFFGRGIHGDQMGRIYFPWNVSNHDVELSCNGSISSFVNVHVKVYGMPAASELRRTTSNIRVRYRDTDNANPYGTHAGIFFQQTVPQVNIVGVGPHGTLVQLVVDSTANMATGQIWYISTVGGGLDNLKWAITVQSPTQIDLQGSTYLGAVYSAGGYLRVPATMSNIFFDLDILSHPSVVMPPVFCTQKNNSDGSVDTASTNGNGYVIENIRLSGSIHNANSGGRCIDFFGTSSISNGVWQNERIANIILRDLTIEGSSASATVDATYATANVAFDNIWSNPGIVWTVTDPSTKARYHNTNANGLPAT